MALPDLSRLESFDVSRARALADRLRALGVTREAIHEFSSIGESLSAVLRPPLQRWHLRREASPLRLALRLLVFMDPVTREEARVALGSHELVSAMLDAGLLVPRAAGVVCPLFLNILAGHFVFSDDLAHGGDAVMGASFTTAALIEAAWPLAKVGRLLDLGCGAGTAGLVFAAQASEVVGTDINPRAIAVARLNARLTGAENAVFRQGDLFAPVENERFDLIVSQPPFVSTPELSRPATFMHGGVRGDEILLCLLRELGGRMAANGRAVLLFDAFQYDASTPLEHIRGALGDSGYDVLLLVSPPRDLNVHVAVYAAAAHPTLGEAYAEAVRAHWDHLVALGVMELRSAVAIVRATHATPWTRRIETGRDVDFAPTSLQIERLARAQDLLSRSAGELPSTRLVVPEGTRFTQIDSDSVRIELPPSSMSSPISCSKEAVQLLMTVNESATVGDAVRETARRLGVGDGRAEPQILAGIRDALDKGLLEVLVDLDP